jgi:hypothetical protein
VRAILAVAGLSLVLTFGPTLTEPAGAGCEGYAFCCGFVLDPPTIGPDGTIHILGSGFEAGVPVEFLIYEDVPADGVSGVPLGTAIPTGVDGDIDVTFSLPPGFDRDGEYAITATCPGGSVASNVLIVSGPDVLPTTTSTPTLPGTGSGSTGDLARVGIALLAAGLVVVALVARQRRAHAPV